LFQQEACAGSLNEGKHSEFITTHERALQRMEEDAQAAKEKTIELLHESRYDDEEEDVDAGIDRM